MRGFILFILIFTLNRLNAQPAVGEYYSSTGKGHCVVKIKKDNTYYQSVSNCTYAFITKGTYKTNKDTLILIPEKTYNCLGRKKKLLTGKDSSSYVFDLTDKLSNYYMRPDSLTQLYSHKDYYYATWKLTKQESK